MNKTIFAFGIAILISITTYQSLAQEKATPSKDLLTGHAQIINIESSGYAAPSVNVGGLLIIEIPDSGSRPPQDMSVKTGGAFEQIGKLRGINTDRKSGRPLMGGGYTWFLYTPKKESKAEDVEVKWTPNGGGGPKTKTYKLEITAGS